MECYHILMKKLYTGAARWPRWLAALALAAVVIGVAVLAHERAHPALIGHLRDDGEYVAYARALLAGQGYVNPAEPGLPPASRYPIGFPLLLAAALAGAPDGAAQLARLAWLGPALLAACVAAAYVTLRRLGGFGPGVALVAIVAIGAGAEVLGYGATLHSDTPFAVIALLTLLLAEVAWRRGPAPGPWVMVGALVGVGCLVRYAGVALLAAVLLGLARARWGRAALAAALGFGAVFSPWIAYRARVGGENYVGTIGEMMPRALADWPLRYVAAVMDVLSNGVPGYFVAPAASAAGGPWLVIGLAISALAAWGAWAWLGDRTASGIAPLFLGATLALTVAVHAGYIYHLPTLPTRYLLPIAPLLWIAAARGGAELARRSAVGPAQGRRLGASCLVACLAALAADHLALHRGGADARQALARSHRALFEAVAREVPTGSRVMSQLHVMLWLHTGRQGFSVPPAPVDGRLQPIGPLPFLMVLEHWRIGYVVVLPGIARDIGAAVPPFRAAFPGVLEAVWAADGGQIFRVAPGPFAAACARHRIRERNAVFEALTP